MTVLIITHLVLAMALVLMMAAWATLLGIPWKELSFGFGHRLASIGRITFRLIPLGGSLGFHDADETTDAPFEDTLQAAPVWKRLVLAIAPISTFLCFGFVVLGTTAWHSFTLGISQVVQGALSPLDSAQVMLADALRVSSEEPIVVFLALAVLKYCAFNLLPFPRTSIGSLLTELLRAMGCGTRPLLFADYVMLLVSAPFALSWMIAVVVFLCRHAAGAS